MVVIVVLLEFVDLLEYELPLLELALSSAVATGWLIVAPSRFILPPLGGEVDGEELMSGVEIFVFRLRFPPALSALPQINLISFGKCHFWIRMGRRRVSRDNYQRSFDVVYPRDSFAGVNNNLRNQIVD